MHFSIFFIRSFILRSLIYSNLDDKIFVLTLFTGKCRPKLRLCERGQCLFFNLEFKHSGSVFKCELRLRNEFQLWELVFLSCQTISFWLRIKVETLSSKNLIIYLFNLLENQEICRHFILFLGLMFENLLFCYYFFSAAKYWKTNCKKIFIRAIKISQRILFLNFRMIK